jgi:uncharacterized integral membrane protein
MVVRFVSDGFLKDDEERGVVVVWEREKQREMVLLLVLMVSNALFVFAFQNRFWKNLKFFFSLLQINIFLVFLNNFDTLISKIILKK